MIPQLSVIFTTYNDSRFVAEALESILCQTLTDFELILADDASTDETLEIVSRYRDPRIKILRNSANLGLAKNLNAALAHCRAELVARQDGDDVSLPTRFEKQVAFMDEHRDVAVVGTRDIWIDEQGNETDRFDLPTEHDEIVEELWSRCCMNHSSVVYRREVVRKLGGYRPLPESEDYDLWFRVAAGHRLANLAERLALRRIRRGSASVDRLEIQTASIALIYRLARQRFDTGRDELDGLSGAELDAQIARLLQQERRATKKLVASKNVEVFHRVLRCSGRRAAWRYAMRALRHDPSNRYVIRMVSDTYLSPSIYHWWKRVKAGLSGRRV